MKILIGTNNLHKLDEFKKIFKEENIDIDVIALKEMPFKVDEPIEDGKNFYENALIKAKYFYDCYHIPCISDDSGIVVEALNGMPGIYSARYGSLYGLDNSSSNNRKVLLEKMKNENNRNAHFECTLVYYDGDKIISSTGIMKGQIAYEEVGTKGFGYDPIFFIPEYNQTVGELDEGIKNKLSHRYNAIINFVSKLKDNKN